MSEKEESWEKKTKAMLKPLEESLGRLSSDLSDLKQRIQERPPSSNGEKTDMPLYKCKNGKCGFATDDLDAYLDHRDGHKAEEEVTEASPAPRKKHETVDEFLSCPECRPRFDKRYLEDGWTPPQKKEPEKKAESKGGLGI